MRGFIDRVFDRMDALPFWGEVFVVLVIAICVLVIMVLSAGFGL